MASRLAPRVLLADEVGLGKTIEAGLIVHRLLATGRAQRVLVLVPEPLVNQWFIELMRRFHLWFHIFDEERCAAIQAGDATLNPFLDDQLVLASIGLLAQSEKRAAQAIAAQAIAAQWDLLVVDEAHHLGWSPDAVSPEYALIEALGRATPGLLLLTATPEQLGLASHFARLRLLDPDRYFDLAEFTKESEQYEEVAAIAGKLLERQPLGDRDATGLARMFHAPPEVVRSRLDKVATGDATARADLLEELLDRHGTGRVMLRNTRSAMKNFPKRIAHLTALEPDPDEPEEILDVIAEEWFAELQAGQPSGLPSPSGKEHAARASARAPRGPSADPKDSSSQAPSPARGTRAFPETKRHDFADDPRVAWLADWLRQSAGEKILLICRTREKVEAIDAALRLHLNIKIAQFHEALPLVQRDRNAAWFAEEDGARVLLCSEIGSEGRNFQFAHHLVLFDLPLDPELVEQRIGRLDRIGQTTDIHVHVPYVRGSVNEALARWMHEGLNAFATNLHGGRMLLEEFREPLLRVIGRIAHHDAAAGRELDDLVAATRRARDTLARRLELGRDRLLELNSFRPAVAARIVSAIEAQDSSRTLDDFMLRVFDHHGIHVEEIGQRTFVLGSAGVFADAFPGLPASGLLVTADRRAALAREDIQFLTWDHPLVTSALDVLLGGEAGNCSFALWPDRRARGLYLETIFLLECVAPAALHLDRFLPATPVRVVVNHAGHDATADCPSATLATALKSAPPHKLLEQEELRDELLPGLLARSRELAEARTPGLIHAAREQMRTQLGHEITRLEELRKINRAVRRDEIELLREQQRALDRHLQAARLRLDAVRLIQRG